MNKIAVVVDNLERGGVANAVKGFFKAVMDANKTIAFDFITYEYPNKEIENYYHKFGCGIFVIKSVSKQGVIRYTKSIKEILLQHGPYVAVHIHTAYFIWLAARMAKKVGIKHIIGHAHGAAPRKNKMIYDFLATVGRALNRKYCTKMFACSEPSGKWTFGKGYTFLPNVVDITKFSTVSSNDYFSEFDIPKSYKVIGYLGVFEREKNTSFLVDIMKTYDEQDQVICVIAGAGSFFDEVKTKIVGDGQQKKVKLIGYRFDVIELLNFFDVLVAPSFSEGMSLTLLEAQLSGIHCIVSANIPVTNDLKLGLYHPVLEYNPLLWKQEIDKYVGNRINLSMDDRVYALKSIAYDSESIGTQLVKAYLD